MGRNLILMFLPTPRRNSTAIGRLSPNWTTPRRRSASTAFGRPPRRAAGCRNSIRGPDHHRDPAGHISGPGWLPIGPLGNLDPEVWYALSAGQEIAVPGLGAELMHHVHADDVAQGFQLAVENRDAAAGSRSTRRRDRR
jgi:hypothetical protein